MDLGETDDPVGKYTAMTGVAKAADTEQTIDSIWSMTIFIPSQ
jgi:hypothetical protein